MIEIEHQYFLDLNFMKMDGKIYLLEFVNHSKLCPCDDEDLQECPKISLPRKTPVLFVQGHLQDVKIYKKSDSL